MATVTIAYMRAKVGEYYSPHFEASKSDKEIAAIYQRLISKPQPPQPKQRPTYQKEDRK